MKSDSAPKSNFLWEMLTRMNMMKTRTKDLNAMIVFKCNLVVSIVLMWHATSYALEVMKGTTAKNI